MTGIKLAELTGKEWRVQPGPLLKGPGSVGVRLGPRHSDSHHHIDLEFLLNVDRAGETSLPDCTTGLAADPEEATRQAIAAWADTTASVALELLEQRGRYATSLGPEMPAASRAGTRSSAASVAGASAMTPPPSSCGSLIPARRRSSRR